MTEEDDEVCCDEFRSARAPGSDAEGDGHLIDHNMKMGYGLPPISFCPWCGKPVAA